MTGKFDQYASDRYQQECLKRLGTIAGDDVSIMNDDLLAATILLRTLEEIDGKFCLLRFCIFTHFANFFFQSSTSWCGLPRTPFRDPGIHERSTTILDFQ